MDANGKTVAGAAADPDDDLQLNYAVWVDGYENGVTQRRAYEQRHMTCRNELSAMANKIWLNTTAKVPNEYLDAKSSTTTAIWCRTTTAGCRP